MNVYGWIRGRGGVEHYRVREPLRGLRLRGNHVRISNKLSDEIAADQDVLLVRGLHDFNSELWKYLATRKDRPLLVYDLDDDIWNWNPKTDSYRYWTKYRLEKAEENIRVADLVTTPSHLFASHLRELNPNVEVVPNTVPAWLTAHKDPPLERFTVGWQGAAQHVGDMMEALPSVLKFVMLRKDVEFRLYGVRYLDGLEYFPSEMVRRVRFSAWEPDIDSYYRSLSMHVGIAPLSWGDPFNHTKSPIKYQEYAAKSIAPVVSFSPTYAQTLIEGETGLFCREPDDWATLLDYLYNNPDLMKKMGARARVQAKLEYTTEGNSRGLEQLYVSNCRRRNVGRSFAKGR